MLVYQKYIIKNISIPVILMTFVSTGLIWITQVIKLLYLIDKGVELKYFLKLVLLIIPALLFIIIPFVTVIGIVFIYNRFNNEKQLTILRNFGLNNFSLAKPAMLFSTVITICCYYISGSLMPYTYGELKNNLVYFKENYTTKIITAKNFNQISKTVTIFVKENHSNSDLGGLVLFDNRDLDNPAILFASRGTIKIMDNVPIVYLQNGNRQAYDNNHNLTKLYFDNLSIELNKTKNSEEKQANKDINEYYISELLYPDASYKEQKKVKLIAEGHQRLIWPLYSFIFTFISLSIFLKQPFDRRSQLKPIGLTILGIFVVSYLHFTFQNLAAKNLQFIYLSYVNVLNSIMIGIYLYTRKSI